MAAPLTDTERASIIAAIESGKSCQTIAAEFARSPDTISRIARSIGWTFGHTNAARARESRSAYCAERRAEIAAACTEKVERILADLERPFMAFNFGGKDNTYAEHEMDRPPVDAVRLMVQSVRDLVRTVLDIDRHDNRADEGLAQVDQWLRGMLGGDS